MKIKTNSNLTSGVIFAIVSAVFYFLIPTQIKTMETSEITARTIPTMLIVAVFVFSLVLILQGVSQPKKTYLISRDTFRSDAMRTELRTLFFIGMMVAYALLFPRIGFLLSSLLLSGGILAYYKCRTWWFYAVAFANIGIVYFVFKVLLRVNLP